VSGFPFAGNHAYIWSDKKEKACSMRGSSGFGFNSENERGPKRAGVNGDDCRPVPGSEGKEDQVMDCCAKDANRGQTFGVTPCDLKDHPQLRFLASSVTKPMGRYLLGSGGVINSRIASNTCLSANRRGKLTRFWG
jgi:hypothetical protein